MAAVDKKLTGQGDSYSLAANPPRFLKGTCKLGVVYAPDGGSLGGFQARNRALPDPSNLLPENFYTDHEREASPSLTGVKQASGAMLPKVNRDLGAPMCTFAVYGISESLVHPSFDLIRGPILAADVPPVNYGARANAGGDDTGTASLIDDSQTRFVPTSNPFIPPSRAGGGGAGANVLNTYNIWRVTNHSPLEIVNAFYVEGQGATTGVLNMRLIQHPSGGLMQVSVFAVGAVAVVERLYPVSQDLAYEEGASLYYPDVLPGAQFPSLPIKARGLENCGFQMHITPAELARSNNPNQNGLSAGITIEWGDNLEAPAAHGSGAKKLDYFALHLTKGRARLEFYDPTQNRLVSQEIGGSAGSLSSGTETSVYVHFAGPNMLIGFDEDVANWSCVTGFQMGQDYTALYTPQISTAGRVRMIAVNVNYTFLYGPIAFNSFCPEQITTPAAANHGGAKSAIRAVFVVPKSDEANIDPVSVSAQFQTHRCLSRAVPDFDKSEHEPTYYGDWRRGAAGGEIAYAQTASDTDAQGDTHVKGSLTWDTTIEGPLFVHIRNFNARDAVKGPAVSRAPLVRDLPWGDLAGHLEKFQVSTRFENDNHSLLSSTATVTLANLAVDPLTDEILARIRENVIAVTLTAGYDTEETFFQGVIDDIDVSYDGAGQTIKITCTDILTAVLGETPCRSFLNFRNMRYGKIIHDLICMSGMGDWYRQSPSPALARALDVRLGYQPVGSPLALALLDIDPTKKPYDVIRDALSLCIDENTTIPVLRWDPADGLLRLDARKDLPIDELYFAGDATPGFAPLPNSFKEREHGVLVKGYSMKTTVKTLYAGLRSRGQSGNKTILYQKDFTGAWDAAGLDLISSDLSERITGLGWVGWRKLLINTAQQTNLNDQLALNLYGGKLEQYLRNPYESVTPSVYVTKPLNHAGRFRVETFKGSGVADEKSIYYYNTVVYSYDKENNTLTADITGEKIPPVVGDPAPSTARGGAYEGG